MEDLELKNMWKEYDRQIEEAKLLNLQSWVINLQTVEYLQTHKAKAKLQSLAVFKTWMVVLGIVWGLFLGLLVFGDRFRHPYFSFSVLVIFLFNLAAIVIYIRHIALIRQINYTESIADAQEKLLRLQASTINVVRILFLPLPFYHTWTWNSGWIDYSSVSFWLINFPILALLTWLGIWLYQNISYKNADKKWFRLIVSGKDWRSVVSSIKDLDEIGKFRKEIAV